MYHSSCAHDDCLQSMPTMTHFTNKNINHLLHKCTTTDVKIESISANNLQMSKLNLTEIKSKINDMRNSGMKCYSNEYKYDHKTYSINKNEKMSYASVLHNVSHKSDATRHIFITGSIDDRQQMLKQLQMENICNNPQITSIKSNGRFK